MRFLNLFFLAFVLFVSCNAKRSSTSSIRDAQIPIYCIPNKDSNNDVREFMREHGMLGDRDGIDEFGSGSVPRWSLVDARVVEGNCFYVMQMCSESQGIVQCESMDSGGLEIEIVASKGGVLQRFEDVVPVPPVQVAINDAHIFENSGVSVLDNNYYFVEFEGKSAIQAWKTIKLKLPVSGLMADISAKNIEERSNGALYGEPDGKVNFDFTPGRKWKLKNAVWLLDRGLTAEVLDVYSRQIDESFLDYYSGSGGKIAPWSSFIMKYFDRTRNEWVPTGIKE
jgi:hypothetical protein